MDKSADSKSSKEMAPKNKYDPENSNNNDEADLQEISAVNESLDELSTALDFFEQRTDNIIEQLKELLHSNREIRQEFAAENLTSANDSNSARTDNTMADD